MNSTDFADGPEDEQNVLFFIASHFEFVANKWQKN